MKNFISIIAGLLLLPLSSYAFQGYYYGKERHVFSNPTSCWVQIQKLPDGGLSIEVGHRKYKRAGFYEIEGIQDLLSSGSEASPIIKDQAPEIKHVFELDQKTLELLQTYSKGHTVYLEHGNIKNENEGYYTTKIRLQAGFVKAIRISNNYLFSADSLYCGDLVMDASLSQPE